MCSVLCNTSSFRDEEKEVKKSSRSIKVKRMSITLHDFISFDYDLEQVEI